jgi:signal transduction histidine kinase
MQMRDDGNRRILVIDDNRAIHEDFRKILCGEAGETALEEMSAGLFGETPCTNHFVRFEIESAFQGREGLEMVKNAETAGRPYGVAFIDVRMPPGWDGIETTAKVWEVCPELQVVICTAYTDYGWNGIAGKLGKTDRLLILKKPFDTVEVLQLAETLSQKWDLARQAKLRLADLDAMVIQRTHELRASHEDLRRSQKMEAVGQLAAGIAHDFNNLLAVIRGNADLGRMGAEGASREVIDCFDQITAASDRAANLTRQLLTFSRKQIMQSQPVDLAGVILNLSQMLKRLIGENIDLRCHYAPALPPVRADIGMLEQVLVNLVINGRDAMPDGGRLIITTEKVTLAAQAALSHPEARPGDFLCMTVADSGSGIAPENLPRIFDPFFTTKEVGKGTGLGLATVYGIVKQHQGWIEVSSKVGAGTTFKIFLAALNCPRPAVTEEAPAPGLPPRGTETVLVVEDEQEVRAITRLILEHFGYRVLEAGSGLEALKIWETAALEVDLLLTDVIMPDGINGRRLAEKLREKKSALKVIFQSGYGGEVMGNNTNFQQETNGYFLQKPCPPRDLLCAVRRCLDGLPA